VRSYNKRDGLQNAVYNQRSVVIAPDRRIVIGGHEGIEVINRLVLTAARPLKEIPQFSGVKVLDEKVKNVGERLELDYSENMFTIQLCSNSGEVHNRARFAYRLEGFSDQWRYTEDARPDITYTGLPSGSYVLCVRMLENDGIMGVTEARLPISIATPWYRSWWMWMVYLMILGAAAYWQYRRSQEKLRLEKLKMERESSHRVDELKQKFEETINDELHQPFRQTFESLNAMMQQETDEQRYEQQQQVFSQVENLLEEVSKLTENNQLKAKLKPQIRELEIESLDEKLVRAATEYVERNLDNADISVETMAEELGMSRVHLYKKLTAITDLTPSEFIRQIRLRHAEQLLSKSQLTVAEVAYKVGFNNPRYFSKYFKEMYGVMPSEYKKTK
jgi:AraC-like DNA-binding protein